MPRGAYLMNLGLTGYREAWELQRSLAAAVTQGAIPDMVILLEHPPTITLGRRTDPGELHLPAGVEVDVVESDRGGKSTYHGPGQLVCYPILDLKRHGRDVKKYCRDLEQAIIQTVGAYGVGATCIEELTGVWLASAKDRVDRRPHLTLGHHPRLRPERRPRPGAVHGVDHRLRARERGLHLARERDRIGGLG
jgi:lipoyl(octanoyl) transferase